MKVVVTGATGFVGRALVAHLRDRGDNVVELSRSRGADLEVQGPWMDRFDGADGVIHLAGESIAAKRWDARRKQQIRDSRIEGTHHVVLAMQRASHPPRVLVSASGVDYYPPAGGPAEFDDDEVTEADPPGDSFLARVCRDWEAEARTAEAFGTRVAVMRTGNVLARDGGMLAKLRAPIGRFGNGRQWWSWIHRDDVIAAYTAALDDARYSGPINLITDSTRQADFAAALPGARWLRVPGFALRAGLGELAGPVLSGRRVVPARLRALGFVPSRPTLARALA